MISDSFCRSGIWEWLGGSSLGFLTIAGQILVQALSSEGLIETEGSAAKMVHSKLAGSSVPLPVGLSTGLLECPPNTVADFVQSKGESAMSFVVQPSRIPSATSTISTGHNCQPGQYKRDDGRGRQKAQIPKAKDL